MVQIDNSIERSLVPNMVYKFTSNLYVDRTIDKMRIQLENETSPNFQTPFDKYIRMNDTLSLQV